MTGEQICVMLHIGLAIEVICVARVRMLIQAIQELPLFLMSMLACNTWWMPQVAGDVCATCGHLQLEELLEVPCDRVAMRRFIEAVVEHCASIQKVLKGYIKKCIQSREEQTLFNRSPDTRCISCISQVPLESWVAMDATQIRASIKHACKRFVAAQKKHFCLLFLLHEICPAHI